MKAFLLVAVAVGLSTFGLACGQAQAPSATPSASPAATAVVAVRPSPSPSPTPLAEPTVVAGVTLYPADEWFNVERRSLCAGLGYEAPFFGPEVFSIRREELTPLELPGEEITDVRVCKDLITVVAYISAGDTIVLVTNGPYEWPVAESLERVSAGVVADRPAVLVAPERPDVPRAAQVIVPREEGLLVVATTGSAGKARTLAEAALRAGVVVPEGKPSFQGILNGVRFFSYLRGENRQEGCRWGIYGMEDPNVDGAPIPPGSPLDVEAAYLPEGYTLFGENGNTCGDGLEAVEAMFSRERGTVSLSVWRLSGEPAWHSIYSEDWLSTTSVAGRPAVIIAPPEWAAGVDVSVEVVVKEEFGLTVVGGRVPLAEVVKVAEGLYP